MRLLNNAFVPRILRLLSLGIPKNQTRFLDPKSHRKNSQKKPPALIFSRMMHAPAAHLLFSQPQPAFILWVPSLVSWRSYDIHMLVVRIEIYMFDFSGNNAYCGHFSHFIKWLLRSKPSHCPSSTCTSIQAVRGVQSAHKYINRKTISLNFSKNLQPSALKEISKRNELRPIRKEEEQKNHRRTYYCLTVSSKKSVWRSFLTQKKGKSIQPVSLGIFPSIERKTPSVALPRSALVDEWKSNGRAWNNQQWARWKKQTWTFFLVNPVMV